MDKLGRAADCNYSRLEDLAKPVDLNALKEMITSQENGEFHELFLNNQLCH